MPELCGAFSGSSGSASLCWVAGGCTPEETKNLFRNGRKVIGPAEPSQGEWVHFERDLHQDFQELWGHVPQRVEKMRVLFEVRYDGKQRGHGEGQADVYFDELYLGE